MSDSDKSVIPKSNGIVSKILSLYHPRSIKEKGLIGLIGLLLFTYLIGSLFLSFWWGQQPDLFDVKENALVMVDGAQERVVTGHTTTATIVKTARILLDKPGGYLANDIALPGVLMDNIPNWEYGVLVQVRDITRSLRNDLSRSQSQSVEDVDLAQAEPQFNFQSDSWMFPATETEYETAIRHLNAYLERLSKSENQNTQFYARADNLRDWLATVEKRLGSLSQRLSASVGQKRVNTDLAGDTSASQSTVSADEVEVKTPWLEIDDVFYEARGSTWALIHFLRAIEVDFSAVLQKKNALVSLRQIIRELESAQDTIWSPVVLNGGGFGFVTNYSLVMANYISRANAAVIDLRNLLEQG
ncbi:DUF2333 family protein [Pseudomonadota bacterium]